MRKFGSDRIGGSFSEVQKLAVWGRGALLAGADPAKRRKDACGASIDFANYGDTTANGTGWEIDHILAVSNGGTDVVRNLQPLQWQNNRAKGDGPLKCAVVA